MTIVSEYSSNRERNIIRAGGVQFVTSAKREYSIATANDGSDGLRFEVRPGDQWAGDAGRPVDYERSEIAWSHTFGIGDDAWIAFDQRISIDHLPIERIDTVNYQCFCFQVHTLDAATIGVSPFLGFNLNPAGELEVMYRGSTTGGGVPQYPYTDEQFEFGAWYRNIVHFKTSGGDATGELEVWRGKIVGDTLPTLTKVVDVSGIALSYPDDTACYPKFGIYRTQVNNVMVAEYENIVVGPTSLVS